MSKLACKCGSLIRDQTDSLSYKARWISDLDEEAAQEAVAGAMAEAAAALQQGKWQEFLDNQFSQQYPRDLDVRNVLNDLLASTLRRFRRDLYECEVCGRLWVETEGNQFASFVPEQEGRGVLAQRAETQEDS